MEKNYFYDKLIQFLAFKQYGLRILEDYYLEDVYHDKAFWQSLRRYVSFLDKKRAIDNFVYRNITYSMFSLRETLIESYFGEFYEFYHDVLHIANNGKGDKIGDFYLQEYLKRSNLPVILHPIVTLLYDKEHSENRERVQSSLGLDFPILLVQSDRFSMDRFRDVADKFMFDYSYFHSLNSFMKENPNLFQDSLFYDRTCYTLETMLQVVHDRDVHGWDPKEAEDYDMVRVAQKMLMKVQKMKR